MGCASPPGVSGAGTCAIGEEAEWMGLGDIDPVCCEERPSVRLGALGPPEDPWRPALDGDATQVVFGPQNGWHVWGHLELCGVRDRVEVQLTVVHPQSGAVLSDNTAWIELYDLEPEGEEDCCLNFVGFYGVLDLGAIGLKGDEIAALACQPITLIVRANDQAGGEAMHSLTLYADPYPYTPSRCEVGGEGQRPD